MRFEIIDDIYGYGWELFDDLGEVIAESKRYDLTLDECKRHIAAIKDGADEARVLAEIGMDDASEKVETPEFVAQSSFMVPGKWYIAKPRFDAGSVDFFYGGWDTKSGRPAMLFNTEAEANAEIQRILDDRKLSA